VGLYELGTLRKNQGYAPVDTCLPVWYAKDSWDFRADIWLANPSFLVERIYNFWQCITMVTGNSFKGITFKGYEDQYSFVALLAAIKVRLYVRRFFESKKAALVNENECQLVFSRGKRIWRYFTPGIETWPVQTITVNVETTGDQTSTVSVTYSVPGWWIRFPPYGLRQEVVMLDSELCKSAAEQSAAANL